MPYSFCTEPVVVNIILPNGNTFVAGNDVSIQCDVRGYPQPYVQWSKDDVEILESQRIRISGKLKLFKRMHLILKEIVSFIPFFVLQKPIH